VLHGAESDIIWLQRDFGLYIVNLFDTYHASKVLERTTGNGLASLLQEYTTFAVDKRYQLADWRIRPLPQEMLLYARSDTHFLLFIYQQLLHHRDMTPERIAEIRRRSAVTASQAYEHVLYDAGNGTGYGGWRGLIERAGKGPMWGLVDERTARDGLAPAISWINTKGIVSLHVFKAVHDWRDALARELDESPRYLLSNKVIFSLAEYPPRTAQALEGAMGGETKPPVKERLEELLAVITPAVARGEQEADRQRQEQADAGVPSGHGAHDEAAPPGFGPASSLLWKATAAAPSAVTSSLFNGQRGGGQGSSGTTPNISASASSLFDSLFAAPSSRSTPPSSGISKFSSVLQRVHSAMLDQLKAVHLSTESEDAATTSNGQQGESALGSPRIKIQQDVMDQDDTAQQGGSSITMLDPNHTFVSNVARTSTSKAAKKEEESDLDDEIVSVSAKSKGRKRKHPKEDAPSGNSSSKKAAKKEEADEPVVPFDYSKAKSVLDAPAHQPAAGVPKAKKPKKDKKGGIIEDGFKAAPKSMSAPKAGNKSYTFTKG
jgi:exosome complex exonuclease RRP6